MNILVDKPKAKKVWFDSENMWILLQDGRQLSIPYSYFPRLLKATSEQRNNYEMSGDGIGLHWEEIDEDISVPNLLLGTGDSTNYKFQNSRP